MIAAPSVLDFRARPPGESYAGIGVLEAGGRVKLYEYEEWIFSAQATLREATNARSRIFLDSGHGLQADARLLIGRTFTILGFPAFSSLEIGYRSPGGFGHEIRADATLGINLLRKFWSFSRPSTSVPSTRHRSTRRARTRSRQVSSMT